MKNNTVFVFVGTMAYEKLNAILMHKSLPNDIERLSTNDQTSCLEGYHSTLNHWHPKMTHFPWLGTYCWYVTYLTLLVKPYDYNY